MIKHQRLNFSKKSIMRRIKKYDEDKKEKLQIIAWDWYYQIIIIKNIIREEEDKRKIKEYTHSL